MAGNATLIPQSIRRALRKGNIPDHEKWNFIDALMEYDLTGTIPNFSNANLAMLFESYKTLIDSNNAKYFEKIQRLAIAGATGGSVRSEAKTAAARKNGAKGGAPRRNRNAARSSAPEMETEPEKQTQPKHLLRLNKNNPSSNSSSSSIDLKNSSSSLVVFPKQPETTTIFNFQNESKKAGFILDKKIARKILRENRIDLSWQTAPYSLIEFAAETVKETYPDKSLAEQKRLFISAFSWEDKISEYPAWRQRCIEAEEAKQRREEAEAEKHCRDEAWRNHPTVCGHCGAVLAPDDRVCPSCSWKLSFDEESKTWKFHEQVNLSAEFQQYIAGTKQ
jgi:hypothetical protein